MLQVLLLMSWKGLRIPRSVERDSMIDQFGCLGIEILGFFAFMFLLLLLVSEWILFVETSRTLLYLNEFGLVNRS